jgi:nickel/cobalt exporter
MARDDAAKLRILLAHWVEHNEEHAGEFTEWALKAKAGGRAPVHDYMMKAVGQMQAANKSLLAALESLKEG